MKDRRTPGDYNGELPRSVGMWFTKNEGGIFAPISIEVYKLIKRVEKLEAVIKENNNGR
ncbi:hypothetical protein LCGC14_1985580 [marine sediment metagenome]|uniref:Uncharacterized protein n=1 Tax=marine sediment metagenome TaxID=412755 RepID=A0A0F9F7J7_9ZZZZ